MQAPAYAIMNQLLAFVKFLYEDVRQEQIDVASSITMKRPGKIPVIHSEAEVEIERFLHSFTHMKHTDIFTLLFLLSAEDPPAGWPSPRDVSQTVLYAV